MSEGGWRVSIFATSPRGALQRVGVDLRRLLADGRDRRRRPWSRPSISPVAPTNPPSARLVTDEHGVLAAVGELHVGAVDGDERVLGRRRLLGAVARVGHQHVGGRDERALRGRTGLGCDVHRGRPVDRRAVLGDHAERHPVVAGRGEDRAGQRQRRPGRDLLGELVERPALGGRELGRSPASRRPARTRGCRSRSARWPPGRAAPCRRRRRRRRRAQGRARAGR